MKLENDKAKKEIKALGKVIDATSKLEDSENKKDNKKEKAK